MENRKGIKQEGLIYEIAHIKALNYQLREQFAKAEQKIKSLERQIEKLKKEKTT